MSENHFTFSLIHKQRNTEISAMTLAMTLGREQWELRCNDWSISTPD